jgi:spore coat polysaccharide biosynthesis protein SpsF
MKESPRKVVLLIQARMSSTRLPKKTLMEINGHSILKLCYQRLLTHFDDVRVLTSNHESDDVLEEYCRNSNITVQRGDLHNVLDRFYKASVGLKSDDIIVRLTADNIFPDGEFVNDVIRFYEENNCEYLTTTYDGANIPYGLSAEVFKKEHLDKAKEYATSEFEKEHVTPWIRENCKVDKYKSEVLSKDYSNLRCTIDTKEDFEKISNLVKDIDILNTNAYKLCDLLKEGNNE